MNLIRGDLAERPALFRECPDSSLGGIDIPSLGQVEASPVDLILESCLNTARKRLGLFGVRNPQFAGNDGSDFVRSSRSAEFPDGSENRSDVPGKLRSRLLIL